jgi:hypothetical protein
MSQSNSGTIVGTSLILGGAILAVYLSHSSSGTDSNRYVSFSNTKRGRMNGSTAGIDSLLQELPQLSIDDFEDILYLYNENAHTLEELADIYNISTRYVATILQAYGVRVSLPARKSLL